MSTIWGVFYNVDQTEGRGPVVLDDKLGLFVNEQEAWDAVNDKGGVMGRHPRNWPDDGPKNWQEYKAKHGYADYDVRPLKLNDDIYSVASDLEHGVLNLTT